MQFLHEYWWCIVSLLGALFVMLLFVQGGQTLIFSLGHGDEKKKRIILNTFGMSKWVFPVAMLVVFCAVLFAAFPKFYAISFSGAIYLWLALLLTIVIQIISCEYRLKEGNLLGDKTYDSLMTVNGILTPIFFGIFVGTLFFGVDYSYNPSRLVSSQMHYSISMWNSPWHGLEALANPKCLMLGLAVLFLVRSLGLLYVIKNVTDDEDIVKNARKKLAVNGSLFLIFFIVFMYFLLTASGLRVRYQYTGTSVSFPNFLNRDFIYLQNFKDVPLISGVSILGFILVIIGLVKGVFSNSRSGICYSALGAVMVVFGLFIVAGWNGTAFYQSVSFPNLSLAVTNSCSSIMTLKVLGYISILIPFVFVFIFWAWKNMNKR